MKSKLFLTVSLLVATFSIASSAATSRSNGSSNGLSNLQAIFDYSACKQFEGQTTPSNHLKECKSGDTMKDCYTIISDKPQEIAYWHCDCLQVGSTSSYVWNCEQN